MGEILTVRQLSEHIRRTVEGKFPYVWVQGEVTNLSRPVSGHVYFSLREDSFLLNCVWFRGRQKDGKFHPLTGEVFEDAPRTSLAGLLQTGQQIICAGSVNVYAARSQYQMIVDLAFDAGGEGIWHQQFEALKRKLSAEGLFDAQHKRPLPSNPSRVAIVTSAKGAAVRDFIRIAGERGTGAEIRIFNTPVQGEDAPPLIAGSLRKAAEDGWPEIVVLIRGGGSIQDLWAFNDEQVVRAVYDCPVPVLTGIGHEIDTSLADLAADFSAATPSHTAQMLWTERSQMKNSLLQAQMALFQSMDSLFASFESRTEALARTLKLLSPQAHLDEKTRALSHSVRLMKAAMQNSVSINARDLEKLISSLRRKASLADSLEPAVQKLLHRLDAAGQALLSRAERKTDQITAQLIPLGRHLADRQEKELSGLAARILALDPFAPLKRGYAFARAQNGNFLHSVTQTAPGDKISVRLADGTISACVESVEPHP